MQVLLAQTLQTQDRENPGRLASAGRRPYSEKLRAGKIGPRLRLRRGAISDHRDDEGVSVSCFLCASQRSPAHKHPSLSLPQTPRSSRRQGGRREAARGDARPTERSPAGHLPLSASLARTQSSATPPPSSQCNAIFALCTHIKHSRTHFPVTPVEQRRCGRRATARMHGRLRDGAESAHPPPSSHLCLHIRAIARLVARL